MFLLGRSKKWQFQWKPPVNCNRQCWDGGDRLRKSHLQSVSTCCPCMIPFLQTLAFVFHNVPFQPAKSKAFQGSKSYNMRFILYVGRHVYTRLVYIHTYTHMHRLWQDHFACGEPSCLLRWFNRVNEGEVYPSKRALCFLFVGTRDSMYAAGWGSRPNLKCRKTVG